MDQGDIEMLAKLIQNGTSVAVEKHMRELLGPEEGREVAPPRPSAPRRAPPAQVIDPDEDEDEGDGIGRSPLILGGESGLPNADDLLGHPLAVLFRAGAVKFLMETYYDDVKGQIVRYTARRGDDAESRPLEVGADYDGNKAIMIVAKRLAKLPPRGLVRRPDDVNSQEMTEGDKARQKARFEELINQRTRG